NVCGEDFLGHSLSVLALVVEDLVLGNDFPHWQGLALENADGQLPPGNELFDHHLIIELTRVPDCCFQIFGPFHHSQSYGRPLFRRFYNDWPPAVLGTVSRRARRHQPRSGRRSGAPLAPPASRNSSLETSLSMASALPSERLPV